MTDKDKELMVKLASANPNAIASDLCSVQPISSNTISELIKETKKNRIFGQNNQ